MNKKLFGIYVESLTREHGAEIIKFFQSQGFNTSTYVGDVCKERGNVNRFYGVGNSGKFYNLSLEEATNILTLEKARELVGENGKTYPRVMLVNDVDDIKNAFKRVVFMEKNGNYLAWINAESFEDSEKECSTACWKYAWEINKKPSRFPFELSSENQKRIMKVACQGWRHNLIDLWEDSFFNDKPVIINEPFYKEMRKDCTDEQHELFNEIFGKD